MKAFGGAFLCLVLSLPVAGQADDLQERIDQIQQISVSAPWQHSEAMIVALKPELERATERQRNQIRLIQIRNMALAGNERSAIRLLEPMLEKPMDPDQKLRAFELNANLHFNVGDYLVAFGQLKEALELVPEDGSTKNRAGILSMAAYFFQEAGLADKALEYGMWSVDLARLSGDDREYCFARLKLNQARYRLGHLAAALDGLEATGKECGDSLDPAFRAERKTVQAEILLAMGRLDPAEKLAEEGLALARFAGYSTGILDAELVKGRIEYYRGRLDQSLATLTDLVGQFEQRERWQQVGQTLDLLADIAEARGQPADALEYVRRARQAREQHQSNESRILLAYLQMEFDTLGKLQEIELLTERNRVLELEEAGRTQQRRFQWATISGATVIAGLLLLLLHRTRSDRLRFMHLSQRDSLTGLYNHTQFLRLAESDLVTAVAEGEQFLLIVADIDHFKQINDEHGHLAGDAALRSVARLLQEVFSPLGPVGRIGGEEFAVALSGVAPSKARVLVQIFSQRLETLRVDARKLDLTLSFGMADARPGQKLEDIRHEADQALYEAKRRGRNRLVEARALSHQLPGADRPVPEG